MSTKFEIIHDASVLGIDAGWIYKEEGSSFWKATPKADQMFVVGEYETREEAERGLVEWLAKNGGGPRTSRLARTGAFMLVTKRTDQYFGDYSNAHARGEVVYSTSEGQASMNSITWTIEKNGEIDFNMASGLGSPLEAEAKSEAIQMAIREAQWALAEIEVAR